MICLIKLNCGDEIMGEILWRHDDCLNVFNIMLVANRTEAIPEDENYNPKFVPWVKNVNKELMFSDHPISWDSILIIFNDQELPEEVINSYQTTLSILKDKYK